MYSLFYVKVSMLKVCIRINVAYAKIVYVLCCCLNPHLRLLWRKTLTLLGVALGASLKLRLLLNSQHFHLDLLLAKPRGVDPINNLRLN